ncbi:hypothetical protein L218DRAFT_193326 [Marasmius fiardii PR-910]|nr:hypothetical protein L218DRAFT_193326 [Marasmius fiardii PR-910]
MVSPSASASLVVLPVDIFFRPVEFDVLILIDHFTQDSYSWNMEQARGFGGNNIVTVLMKHMIPDWCPPIICKGFDVLEPV